MEKEGGELCEGRAHEWGGGCTHTQASTIHGFDICVLLDSLLRARLSSPPHHRHQHPLAFAISPLVSAEKSEQVWEGRGQREKTDPFSLDVLQCQARRDRFKDEVGVNVVGRMTELL